MFDIRATFGGRGKNRGRVYCFNTPPGGALIIGGAVKIGGALIRENTVAKTYGISKLVSYNASTFISVYPKEIFITKRKEKADSKDFRVRTSLLCFLSSLSLSFS